MVNLHNYSYCSNNSPSGCLRETAKHTEIAEVAEVAEFSDGDEGGSRPGTGARQGVPQEARYPNRHRYCEQCRCSNCTI